MLQKHSKVATFEGLFESNTFVYALLSSTSAPVAQPEVAQKVNWEIVAAVGATDEMAALQGEVKELKEVESSILLNEEKQQKKTYD